VAAEHVAAIPSARPPSAIVTGGSRGIGRAIAGVLAEEGLALTLVGRDTEALASAVEQLTTVSPSADAFACDLRETGHLPRLVEQHVARCGGLDLLVLNAGTGTSGSMTDYTEHHLDSMLRVNVTSSFALLRLAIPELLATARTRGAANVVAITSITGKMPEAGLAAYAASKAAVQSMCRSINVEYGGAGLRATSINPGYVDTAMSRWVHERLPSESMIRPQDVAEAVRMLTRLSKRAHIPDIDITRLGADRFEA
jgi:short-subunit dehydrogenase